MEHMFSSRKDKYLIIDPHIEDGHEVPNSSNQEEPPLFSGFPSPFFDDIDTLPTLSNNHTHQHHRSSTNKSFNITDDPMPTESKRIKKRSVGKKDRHSKIHTAQGLRDRRMRLSLHIARKFFHLQDLLGFDKASKTIEWLFCKSNKAIKELADNFDPKHNMTEEIDMMDSRFTDQCEMGLRNKIKVANNIPENLREMDQIYKKESRNRIQNNSCSRETRDQARARARERTRERVMIKELEKSNFLVGGNPKDEISKLGLGLGYFVSPDHNQNIEELGYTSNASESVQQQSSSPSLDFSSTHHLLGELQLANMNVDVFRTPENYCTTFMNHNPPAGWLNSSYGFQGIPGGFEADSYIPECCNYGIVPSNSPVTADVYEQNPSSFFMPTATNFLHFQSQNQEFNGH